MCENRESSECVCVYVFCMRVCSYVRMCLCNRMCVCVLYACVFVCAYVSLLPCVCICVCVCVREGEGYRRSRRVACGCQDTLGRSCRPCSLGLLHKGLHQEGEALHLSSSPPPLLLQSDRSGAGRSTLPHAGTLSPSPVQLPVCVCQHCHTVLGFRIRRYTTLPHTPLPHHTTISHTTTPYSSTPHCTTLVTPLHTTPPLPVQRGQSLQAPPASLQTC